MKRKLRNSFVWGLLTLVVAACSDPQTAHEGHDVYTCPMHPAVVSDRPGACPVCGMDLVTKARADAEVEITPEIARAALSPNASVLSLSASTIRGQYFAMPVSVEAQGVVTYDPRRVHVVAARVEGRLEHTHLRYAYQPVTKGQKIADIYSPALATAQRELLSLLDNDAENKAAIDRAKQKLILMGMDESQLRRLMDERSISQTFSVYSPYHGYVGPEFVRAGDYAAAGEALFTIVDPDALRIELNLPASWAGLIREGNDVELDFLNGRGGTATVDFVQPYFEEQSAFIKARIYTDNAEELRIGELLSARVLLDSVEALWIPRESVLDLGMRQIVFVKETGSFRPRTVETGLRMSGMVEIKAGLASAEEIAANGQFLVDSEGFVQIPSARSSNDFGSMIPRDEGGESHGLMLTDVQLRLANITTGQVKVAELNHGIALPARLIVDETKTEMISTRVSGRVEKLYVKETGRRITANEPLYTLYSEELLTLQREYLLAREQYVAGQKHARYRSLLDAAERKLMLYGLSKSQIRQLNDEHLQSRISIPAPTSGVVTAVEVKEGQYVRAGDVLYRKEDLRSLRVEAELYPGEISGVAAGDKIRVKVPGAAGDEFVEATVDFLSPKYRDGTRVAVIRASLDNAGAKWRPGQFAEVYVAEGSYEGVAVPVDAVIRDQQGAYVYVQKGDNNFHRRRVTIGFEGPSETGITSGLAEGETIAVTGVYLLHSEYVLKMGADPLENHDHKM